MTTAAAMKPGIISNSAEKAIASNDVISVLAKVCFLIDLQAVTNPTISGMITTTKMSVA